MPISDAVYNKIVLIPTAVIILDLGQFQPRFLFKCLNFNRDLCYKYFDSTAVSNKFLKFQTWFLLQT